MIYLLTFDPGMSTGITLGRFDDIQPYERLQYWQIHGGLPGLMVWLADNHALVRACTVVCEKFVPLPMARSFKLDELEPIRIEGALVMLVDVIWQRPSAMVLAGGNTPAERKRNSDDILRRGGLWLTGKSVGYKDANDVNAAQKHALAYLTRINHTPTIEKYRDVH